MTMLEVCSAMFYSKASFFLLVDLLEFFFTDLGSGAEKIKKNLKMRSFYSEFFFQYLQN